MNSNNTLKLIDRFLVVASIAGLAFTGVTKQPLYVATPLSINAVVGLLRREKSEKESKSNTHLNQPIETINKLDLLESSNSQISQNSAKLISHELELEEINYKLSIVENKIDIKDTNLGYESFVNEIVGEIEKINDELSIVKIINQGVDDIEKILQDNNTDLDEIVEYIVEGFVELKNVRQHELKIDEMANEISTINSINQKHDLNIDELIDKHNMLVNEFSIVEQEKINGLEKTFNDFINTLSSQTDNVVKYIDEEFTELENVRLSDKETIELKINEVEEKLAAVPVLNSFERLIENSLHRQFAIIEQFLSKKNTSYSDRININLVHGRKESRKIFLSALKGAKARLIFVCPWLSKHGIDPEVEDLIKSALNRGVKIDIGWGHLRDVTTNNDKSKLSEDNLLACNAKRFYAAVPWLKEIQSQYPKLLKLKILGTHEKYLVCDRDLAMIGSHNFMNSGMYSMERELGIVTDDLPTIEQIVTMYDSDT